jgi:IS30 family transposase
LKAREGDLIMGGNNSQIAILVERHTRYVMLVRVKSKDTKLKSQSEADIPAIPQNLFRLHSAA